MDGQQTASSSKRQQQETATSTTPYTAASCWQVASSRSSTITVHSKNRSGENSDAEFFRAALHAGGGAAVLHVDGLDVPGGGLDLALHALDLDGFRRGGHG